MDTSTNRDYQWIGDFIEVESNGRMKLPTFSIPSDAELKLRVVKCSHVKLLSR